MLLLFLIARSYLQYRWGTKSRDELWYDHCNVVKFPFLVHEIICAQLRYFLQKHELLFLISGLIRGKIKYANIFFWQADRERNTTVSHPRLTLSFPFVIGLSDLMVKDRVMYRHPCILVSTPALVPLRINMDPLRRAALISSLSDTDTEHNSGHRTDPCGTPDSRVPQ